MSPRQRIRLRRTWLTVLGQLVAGVLALTLLWGAAVAGALAAGVEVDTVRSLSGYQDAYDFLSKLTADDVTSTTVRTAVGAGGLVAAILLGLMARAQLPAPRLARGAVELEDGERGRTTVAPRAVERAAESAAVEHPAVSSAFGRWATDGLALDVTLSSAGDVAGVLRAVRDSARKALETHGLPVTPVDVTLTKFDPADSGRELD